jgi:ribosomal protein L40E
MDEKGICQKCGFLNELQNQYCEQCGKRLSSDQNPVADMPRGRYCPHCNADNPIEAISCVYCGRNMESIRHSSSVSNIGSPPSFFATRIDKLGTRLDGWADLIDNAADKADDVRLTFEADLELRQMPQVDCSQPTLTPGGLAGKRRNYYLAQSYIGATLAVYIGEFGRDLYVSWDLFVRPQIRWRNILIMLGIAAVIAIFPAMNSYSEFSTWISWTIAGFIGIVMVALTLGKMLRGSAKAFFVEEIDHFAADDVTATMFAVHHGLMKAIDAAGLDSSLLRAKETFKAGRRERII